VVQGTIRGSITVRAQAPAAAGDGITRGSLVLTRSVWGEPNVVTSA